MKKGILKRTVSLFMGLCMAFLCLPEGALFADAATDYDLLVNEKRVTSSNASNVLGNGNFRYDASTKTLYMKGDNDFSRKAGSGYVCGSIHNEGIAGLTICLEGNSTLIGTIWCEASTTITGDYSLKIENTTKDGQKLEHPWGGKITMSGDHSNLTLKNTKISLSSRLDGSGQDFDCALEVIHSDLKVQDAVMGFNSGIKLTQCYLKSPDEGKIADSFIFKNGSSDPIEIVRGYDLRIEYGVSIKTRMINAQNAGDVFGDGVFRFDSQTATLTVGGNSPNAVIVNESCKDLTIKTVKDSQIQKLILNADTTLTGSALLMTGGQFTSGAQAVVTVKDANLSLYGFEGDRDKAALNIINSNVRINDSVRRFASGITLKDCYIKSPKNTCIQGGDIIKTDSSEPVLIVPGENPNPHYGIMIGSTLVNDKNASDILGDGIFKYDAESNTLTINGSSSVSVSNNECSGLTVKR